MLDRTKRPSAGNGAAAPPDALAFLGPAPLVEGECSAAYDELLARISGALKPADILEDIWIRDIVDLVWEGFRLRRAKAELISACTREGLRRTLWNSLDGQADEVTRKWAIRDEAASETVRAALANAGLTLEGLTARRMSVTLADFERLDRMITAVETRRHHALRELDKHRASLAQRLRTAIAEAEEAEFSGEAKPTPAPT